jgi:hypothetical protein
MNEVEAVRAVLTALQRHNAPHFISGSLSANAYSEPRSTKDADIVIDAPWETITAILNDLSQDFEVDRQMRWEGVTGTSRFVVRHLASRFIVELFLLSDDAFDRSRFERRVPLDYDGLPTFIMTAEDVIVQKALWSLKSRNPKHAQDIANVLRYVGPTLDWDYIHHWAKQHGTDDVIEELRQEVEATRPPDDTP